MLLFHRWTTTLHKSSSSSWLVKTPLTGFYRAYRHWRVCDWVVSRHWKERDWVIPGVWHWRKFFLIFKQVCVGGGGREEGRKKKETPKVFKWRRKIFFIRTFLLHKILKKYFKKNRKTKQQGTKGITVFSVSETRAETTVCCLQHE